MTALRGWVAAAFGTRAAPETTAARTPERARRREYERSEVAGLGWLALGLFLVVALAFKAAHALLGTSPGPGLIGSFAANATVWVVGWSGAFLVACAPLAHALRGFGRLAPEDDRRWLALLGGLALLVPVGAGLAAHAPAGELSAAAGMWGGLVSYYAARALGVGAWLLLAFAACSLTVCTVAWNPVRALLAPRAPGAPPLTYDDVLGADAPAVSGRRGRKKAPPFDIARALEPAPEEMPAADRAMLEAARDGGAPALAGDGSAVASAVAEVEGGRRGKKARGASAPGAEPVLEQIRSDVAAEAAAEAGGAEVLAERPPRDLLDPAPPRNFDVSKRELDAAAAKLEEVLRTFRIDGQITGRTVGPTVTQFEYTPAAGVKVRQIASLADDLALAMRAPSIRIVAPIPGRGAVGIEVPNATREMVAFRDLVESREFQDAKAALPIALGKDLEGRVVVADLAKTPHLLIAGATGAGKSVCVNTIITSLIYRHTPRTLRFLMVDPKMVELSVYNDLPHMRHKVITDSKDAASVLKWALMEMEERYALLAENGCRNLQDFNRRVRQHAEGSGAALKAKVPADTGFLYNEYTKGELPYVVVVIDEMADLMMTVQGEVETPIARLAQKARAIGIHLIIATQRPSVNVITGLIKANFPSRIAFRVASQIDSRTIIDGAGAEMLLGNGDLLFVPPGSGEPSRIQGAYLSSEETERLMGWYRDRASGTSAAARALAAGVDAELGAAAAAEEDILEVVKRREALDSGAGIDDEPAPGDRDKLFYEAAEVCVQHQGGSTSLLQRRLKIGYGRAARIIDQLHLAGVLGPPDGSKPRDVLVGLEELHRLPSAAAAGAGARD